MSSAYNMNGDVNPNNPLVHQQRQEQKITSQMDKMLKNNGSGSENGGNNSLISSHNVEDNGYDTDDKEQEEFAELLKEYKLSRCKEQFAKDDITSSDDLKRLTYQELDHIESKLPKLKRKQFIKLVQAVSEVCKNYKKDNNKLRLSANPNANNSDTFFNNNNNNIMNSRQYVNHNTIIQQPYDQTVYPNNVHRQSPSINTSPVYTHDQKLLGNSANMNGQSPQNFNGSGILPSINTSPVRTHDQRLVGNSTNMNRQSAGNFTGRGRGISPSINTSPVHTHDQRLFGNSTNINSRMAVGTGTHMVNNGLVNNGGVRNSNTIGNFNDVFANMNKNHINNGYQYGQKLGGNFNGEGMPPSIISSPLHTHDHRLGGSPENKNGNNWYHNINNLNVHGQSPGNFSKHMPSINSSPMRTYDKKLNATPRPWNQYNM